jgi:hypothetical protein
VTRRTVRVDQQFFTELDAQLDESRGPNGEPSASDFLLIELPTIAEAFAARFDELLSVYPNETTTATWSPAAASCTQLSSSGN